VGAAVWGALRRRVHDPGHFQLRVAARALILVPTLFAAFDAAGHEREALFAAFASFSLVVFADFGGPTGPRARAYVITTIAGGVLVTLGTLCGVSVWIATPGMVLVAAVVLFASGAGGYFTPAASPLVLSFVLAVCVPGGAADLAPRLTGWFAGCVAATIAGIALWPKHSQFDLRRLYADAAEAVAACIDDPDAFATATRAVDALREGARTAPHRPTGPRARTRALLLGVESLDQTLDSLRTTPRPIPSVLIEAMHRGLHTAAATLRGETIEGPATDAVLQNLVQARISERVDSMNEAAAGLHRGRTTADTVARLDATAMARLCAVSALATTAYALLAVGVPIDRSVMVEFPGDFEVEHSRNGLAALVDQARRITRLRSIRVRNALRGALGLGAAVAIALLTNVEHGFWVALGALTVLRSSAMRTGRTYLESLAGTVVGFAVVSGLVLVTHHDHPMRWVLFPLSVFAAAYTPNAVSFIVGQAAFTVWVVIMFDLLTTNGLSAGEVRVLDIAIGGGVAVGIGLCFWPRGARGTLGRTLADLFRSAGTYFETTTEDLLRGQGGDASPRALATADETSEAEALDTYLVERRGDPMVPAIVAVTSVATFARVAGDQLRFAHEHHFDSDPVPAAVEALRPATATVGALLRASADAVATGASVTAPAAIAPQEYDRPVVLAIDAWREDLDAEALRRAVLGIVIAREYTRRLDQRLRPHLADAIAIGQHANAPWWR